MNTDKLGFKYRSIRIRIKQTDKSTDKKDEINKLTL